MNEILGKFAKKLREAKAKLLERINPHNPIPTPKPVKPRQENE